MSFQQKRNNRKKRYPSRDRGTYFSDRREKEAEESGRIKGKVGNPCYLTQEEEKELVSLICNWKNPLTLPTVFGLASHVSSHLS
jgi:hypothetical protein